MLWFLSLFIRRPPGAAPRAPGVLSLWAAVWASAARVTRWLCARVSALESCRGVRPVSLSVLVPLHPKGR